MYKEIELEKKAIHHFFLAFSSKPYNFQNQPLSYFNSTKVDTGIRQDNTGITYIGTGQPINVFIGQACYRGAYYLYGKTKHFAHKCPNQKAQIKAVFYAITGKKRQVWVNEMRELDCHNYTPLCLLSINFLFQGITRIYRSTLIKRFVQL